MVRSETRHARVPRNCLRYTALSTTGDFEEVRGVALEYVGKMPSHELIALHTLRNKCALFDAVAVDQYPHNVLVCVEDTQHCHDGRVWLSSRIVVQVAGCCNDLIRGTELFKDACESHSIIVIRHNKGIERIGKHALDDWGPAPLTKSDVHAERPYRTLMPSSLTANCRHDPRHVVPSKSSDSV